MKKFLISIFFIVSISLHAEEGGDLNRYITEERDSFDGREQITLMLHSQSEKVSFKDPQEPPKRKRKNARDHEGCKIYSGNPWFSTTLRVAYMFNSRKYAPTVYIYTMLPGIEPRYGDLYNIKVGDNYPIVLNENKNDWDEINPEVLFGTEQPSYKSFSLMYKKQYQLLDQLITEEEKGLDYVVYRIRREGRDDNRNEVTRTSDCRVKNNGRFKYMKTRADEFISKHNIVFKE